MTHPKDVLQREADARFWAQTGYRVGQKLDLHSAADQAMVPVWRDILRKVRAEDERGALQLTYNHPDVERHLDDAAAASHAVAGHLDAASHGDPWAAGAHAEAAGRASQAAASSTAQAAAVQPPTVSTMLADVAAAAASAAGRRLYDTILDRLAPDHPALTSPAAHPAPPHPDEPPPVPTPALPMTAPPTTAADHLAIAQAQAAPDVAAQVHDAAAAQPARGGRSAPSLAALHPQAVADIRQIAQQLAADSAGRDLGVVYRADETWSVPAFSARGEAEAWYRQLADTPDAIRYVAYFDKSDPGSWPAPVNEVFGSSRGVGTAASSTRDDSRRRDDRAQERRQGTGYGVLIALGAVAVGGAVAVAASRRQRRGAAL